MPSIPSYVLYCTSYVPGYQGARTYFSFKIQDTQPTKPSTSMDMESYCSALLNQEKSLEELQRHLRTTEELFRESVKRKNQQLDLLQGEVRRLKTSVAGRDQHANSQIEAALGAQAAEVRRLKELLSTRDADVESLQKQISQLQVDLKTERSKRMADAELADQVSLGQDKCALVSTTLLARPAVPCTCPPRSHVPVQRRRVGRSGTLTK